MSCFSKNLEHYATTTVTVLPATEKRLQDISTAQKDDEVCAEVQRYCHEGWPAFMPQIPLLRAYWESRSHLAIINDLLLYDERCHTALHATRHFEDHPRGTPWDFKMWLSSQPSSLVARPLQAD